MPLYVFSRTQHLDDETSQEQARSLTESTGAKVVRTASGSLVLMVEADQLEAIKTLLPGWEYGGETKAKHTK